MSVTIHASFASRMVWGVTEFRVGEFDHARCTGPVFFEKITNSQFDVSKRPNLLMMVLRNYWSVGELLNRIMGFRRTSLYTEPLTALGMRKSELEF